MNSNDDHQEMKSNLWGTLAAQLEEQCTDVLSSSDHNINSSRDNNNDGGAAASSAAMNNMNNSSSNGAAAYNNEPLLPSASAVAAVKMKNGGQQYTSSRGNNNNGRMASSTNVETSNIAAASSISSSSLGGDAMNNSSGVGDDNAVAAAASTSSQHQARGTITAQLNTGGDNSTITTGTTKSLLKDWIINNKINRREVNNKVMASNKSSSSNSHVEKYVKVAYLIVTKLLSLNKSNSSNSNISNSNDIKISEDCIIIVENSLGEVVDVLFDVEGQQHQHADKNSNSSNYSSSNNNNNLGSTLEALGKLFYKLFTKGKNVPTENNYTSATTTAAAAADDDDVVKNSRKRVRVSTATLMSMDDNNVQLATTSTTTTTTTSTTKKKKSSRKGREEDDIMDILLNFDVGDDNESDRKDDYITSSMREVGGGGDIDDGESSSNVLPLHLCRFVSDLLYSSRVMLDKKKKNNNGRNNNSGGDDDDVGERSRSSDDDDEHQGSIFTSISDVHSDLKQMIDYPDAFLYGTVNSRWEIVFGSNHLFGREKEMDQLMNVVHRIQRQSSSFYPQRMKEVVMISGHAGTGKSLLVQEIRKPLQAQGWIFLRCKFEKKMCNEPLSVLALGFDEYFASCAVCPSAEMSSSSSAAAAVTTGGREDSAVKRECSCSNVCCARKICRKLEELIGRDGSIFLSMLMPSLRRIMADVDPDYTEKSSRTNNNVQGQNQQHLFVTLLDILSQLRPILFFTDDLQWAGGASLELLRGLVNRASNNVLFVGAYRAEGSVCTPSLSNMLENFEANELINTTQIALESFELESLNEMVSEALCLPRRKTRSLAEVVHQKTLGVPLFVVEFLDALLTDKLLVRKSTTGWGWDVDSIDLKKISNGVAELLSCKLQQIPEEVLSAVKILSVLGSHVDRRVLEAVKSYDGSDGSTLIPSLYAAQREGLLDIAGPTFTFGHDTIMRNAFNLIADRIPTMLRIVACLLPYCKNEERSDLYLYTTVDIINRIGYQAVPKNQGQSQVFAQLNLQAGKKAMVESDFRSAAGYFDNGISYLQGDCWNNQYELTLSLYEYAATANFSAGHHDKVAKQTNTIFSMARTFEDKFKSYCLYINVLAIGSLEKAMEQIYHLLNALGENINPNTINAPMAIVDFQSLKQMLGGTRKDVLLQLPPLTDRSKQMAMKLMSMLVLYYNQQITHMSGYFACKMIRMSIQNGHCEDTVFALSVFSCSVMNFLDDANEASSLAKCTLSLSRLYKAEQLIPRIYSRIYGAILCFTQPMVSALPSLLKACRVSFDKGTSEQSVFNTAIYVSRSLQCGKKLPVLLDEVKAFAAQHNQFNHMSILQLFLAPVYRYLSNLTGITLDRSTLLQQLADASSDDVVETAVAKKETLFVRVNVVMNLVESLLLRDFARVYQTMIRYPRAFQMLDDKKQMKVTEFDRVFWSGFASFHFAREMREPQWIQRGMNAVAAFEEWTKLNAWNFLPRYHLLKAELYHTQGDITRATESFDAAIAAAKKHHSTSFEAIACEWAAHFYHNIDNIEKAKQMIQQSHDAYVEWGAAKKAAAVIKLLQVQVTAVGSSSSSTTIRNQQQRLHPTVSMQPAAL